MGEALVAGIAVAMAIMFIVVIVKSLIIICPPNRVAVISGRTRTLSDGRTVGYRILRGGRTLRIPIIERVAWMDLNIIPLEVSVTNAYSKGAIPLNVQGIANVKVSSSFVFPAANAGAGSSEARSSRRGCSVSMARPTQAALARICPADERVADRFEVFHGATELANGYVELTTDDDKSHRFDQEIEKRKHAGQSVSLPDAQLLAALDHGLPDCAGVAVGLERLQMIHAQADNIANVVTFI